LLGIKFLNHKYYTAFLSENLINKEIDKDPGKHLSKTNDQQDEMSDQIDTMLAFGFVNLGLTNINTESYAEERIKEDLKNKLKKLGDIFVLSLGF
jgi:hypothetical protein